MTGLARVGASGRDASLSPEAREFFAGMAAAPHTRDAYGRQWARFVNWCQSVSRSPEPATTETVLSYMHWLWSQPGKRGRPTSPNTVALGLAAIRKRHSLIAAAARAADPEAMYPIPDPDALRAAHRAYAKRWKLAGHRPLRTREIRAQELRPIVEAIDLTTVRGVRDAAVLTLGFGMYARSAEMASLLIQDVMVDAEGLTVHVPYSKTDQGGAGEDTEVIIAPGDPLCPVTAFNRWVSLLAAEGISTGPLFFPVRLRRFREGERSAMSPPGLSDIVRRHVGRSEVLPKGEHIAYGFHSLRAGGATSAAEAGARLEEIIRQGRWSERSPSVLRYLRKGQGRTRNAMRDVYQARQAQGGDS